jgi:hypothetical protein
MRRADEDVEKIEGGVPSDGYDLHLNWFEVGWINAVVTTSKKKGEIPRRLRLKLDIASTAAYLNHPTLAKKAKEDIRNFQEELRKLEKSDEIRKG